MCHPAGVCAGNASSDGYSDVEDASSHTEVVYVRVRAQAEAVVVGEPVARRAGGAAAACGRHAPVPPDCVPAARSPQEGVCVHPSRRQRILGRLSLIKQYK